jgi:putative transposase
VDGPVLPLAVAVTAADLDDGTHAPRVPGKLGPASQPRLALLWADRKHNNRALGRWLAQRQVGYRLEVVSRPTGAKGFVLLHRRWVAERTFAWLGRRRRNRRTTSACRRRARPRFSSAPSTPCSAA